MSKNFYDILGVSKTATKDEIKKAFYKKASEHHPDKKGGDDKKFKEINEAYQTLSDDKKRAQFDRFRSDAGSAGFSGFGGQGGNPFGGFDFSGFGGGFQNGNVEFDMGDIGDIFGDIFGGGRQKSQRVKRGADMQMGLEVELSDILNGGEKEVSYKRVAQCKTCEGFGFSKHTKQNTCKKCSGKGNIQTQKRTIFGSIMQQSVCDECEGAGKIPESKCSDCKGKGVNTQTEKIKIKIPKGIDDGEALIMRGYGEAVKGGASGDLYIVIRILTHKVWERIGKNLHTDVEVSLTDILLGKSLELDYFGKKLNIDIGELSNPKKDIVKKGYGLTVNGVVGDAIISLELQMPKKLSNKEKELLSELKNLGM